MSDYLLWTIWTNGFYIVHIVHNWETFWQNAGGVLAKHGHYGQFGRVK
jgi:hypothetical protein